MSEGNLVIVSEQLFDLCLDKFLLYENLDNLGEPDVDSSGGGRNSLSPRLV